MNFALLKMLGKDDYISHDYSCVEIKMNVAIMALKDCAIIITIDLNNLCHTLYMLNYHI